jgi:hypothetical protein
MRSGSSTVTSAMAASEAMVHTIQSSASARNLIVQPWGPVSRISWSMRCSVSASSSAGRATRTMASTARGIDPIESAT